VFAARSVTQPVDGRYDVVLTTNGGHPLDRNLYQAVKGMAAAERVVRHGGIIVMTSACGDGVPEGAFADILDSSSGPEDVLRQDGPTRQDGWQAQVLGRVLRRAEVWLHSDGLSDEAVRSAWLRPIHDLAGAVREALDRQGPGARLCVLPEGPLVVATAVEEEPVP
jgi:nickel-dependent lactate racemase